MKILLNFSLIEAGKKEPERPVPKTEEEIKELETMDFRKYFYK
jgi:hypothetical protein